MNNVQIKSAIVIFETDKAYLLNIKGNDYNLWFPKSRCKFKEPKIATGGGKWGTAVISN